MPAPKRNRRERTEEWSSIKQWTLWPEQELYEQIRPLVLFHETAGERAKEIDVPQRTLARKSDEFERYGIASLFPSGKQGGERDTSKTLPPEIRQLITDLHAELPTMSWREIAEICYIRYGRRPDHKSVKHIATASPALSLRERRYQPWHLIADPAERKLAVVRLHSEGWSTTSIAEYLQTTRPTIYATLQHWTEEGPVCCMRPNSLATSISMDMSASKTGGSLGKTAWREKRSPSGCTKERSRLSIRQQRSQSTRFPFCQIIRASKR